MDWKWKGAKWEGPGRSHTFPQTIFHGRPGDPLDLDRPSPQHPYYAGGSTPCQVPSSHSAAVSTLTHPGKPCIHTVSTVPSEGAQVDPDPAAVPPCTQRTAQHQRSAADWGTWGLGSLAGVESAPGQKQQKQETLKTHGARHRLSAFLPIRT